MPTEPNAYWWPIFFVCASIVAIGGVWFTRWVIERLDKDRSKLHQHGTTLTVHTLEIQELRDDVDDLKREDR